MRAARRRGQALVLAWALAAGAAGAGPALLDDPEPVPFAIVDQALPDVLREFGSAAEIPMTVDQRVEGRVTDLSARLSARGFLDRLAADHGLAWYFDGTSIHVTPAAANGSVVIDFGAVPAETLEASLAAMGIADPRYGIRRTGEGGVGVVTGPPRYVDLVEQTFLMLAKREPAGAGPKAATRRIVVVRGESVETWSGMTRLEATSMEAPGGAATGVPAPAPMPEADAPAPEAAEAAADR